MKVNASVHHSSGMEFMKTGIKGMQEERLVHMQN